MKQFINRRALALGAASVAALLVAGACSVIEGTEGGGSALPVVKFGATLQPSSIGMVAEVIKERSLDEECGINLDVTSFSPDAAEIALLSGQTDVGYFGFNSWAGSSEKLEKLAMIEPLQAEHGVLYVREDSPSTSLEDLKGQKIALLPPVSAQYNDFKMLVAKMGMDLESDFEAVTGPPPAIEAFLKRGEVAAAILFEPNGTNLEQAGGYRPLFSLNERWTEITGDPLYMLGVSANRTWLEGNEAEAQCAAEAIHAATELLANDDSVYAEFRADLEVEDDDHLAMLAENLGAIYTAQTADEASSAVREQLEIAKDLGLIDTVPDPIFTPLGD
ncbi:ABC transporter substrate-binding protein [Aeromicrobium sp. CTD01-1L150]|uniref:ABC transporter substrate-binding protein n=1 Tax=Aeromicrobium sp. CTD01-1L150 TaxID=3341830 RepID=UPI0035C0F9B4